MATANDQDWLLEFFTGATVAPEPAPVPAAPAVPKAKCPKCQGNGMPHLMHRSGGVCFRCGATPRVFSPR